MLEGCGVNANLCLRERQRGVPAKSLAARLDQPGYAARQVVAVPFLGEVVVEVLDVDP